MAWAEAKSFNNVSLEGTVKTNLEYMMENDYHINLGVDREVVSTNKNGKIYFVIRCYTLAGRNKGQYKCGHIDNEINEYVYGRYDDVDALKKEYVGE